MNRNGWLVLAAMLYRTVKDIPLAGINLKGARI